MTPSTILAGQHYLMNNLVLGMRRVMDDVMESAKNGLDEQMSSECAETFFYICLDREDCLPEKHQANLVPWFSGTLEHHFDAAKDSLRFILNESRISRTLSEQLEYLLELFKKEHKVVYPNATLIAVKGIFEKAQKARHTFINTNINQDPIHPEHIEKMESAILDAENVIEIAMSKMGDADEQMTGDFIQSFFYTSLGLERYLPEYYQNSIVIYIKLSMVAPINASKLVWLEIAKELAVVPNEYLLPQLIAIFRTAFQNLYSGVEFLETTDGAKIPWS